MVSEYVANLKKEQEALRERAQGGEKIAGGAVEVADKS